MVESKIALEIKINIKGKNLATLRNTQETWTLDNFSRSHHQKR